MSNVITQRFISVFTVSRIKCILYSVVYRFIVPNNNYNQNNNNNNNDNNNNDLVISFVGKAETKERAQTRPEPRAEEEVSNKPARII